jgi:hypothetical protein
MEAAVELVAAPPAEKPPMATGPWATAYTLPSAPIRGVTNRVPPRKLSESHLPQALLDFWKLLDAKLVKEAEKNPALTIEQILTARKNLGFDLLVTRQMFPFALKPAQAMLGAEVKPTRVSADTALPVLATTFANTMSAEFHTAWPAFFANAIASFDA